MTTAEHAADEAGGEVIYSYDGDEHPAIVTQSPPLASVARGNSEKDEAAPSALQAFETFAGKVYAPPSSTATVVGAFSSLKGETALERLGRLQQEIQQLEIDLSLTAPKKTLVAPAPSASPDAASGGVLVETVNRNEEEEDEDDVQTSLLLTVQDMKVRLARVGVIPPQDALTAHVQTAATSIQSLSSKADSGAGGAGDVPSTTTSAPPQDTATTAPGRTFVATALETRLQRLERLTGLASVSSASYESASFLERLMALEETFLSKVLDDKELEIKAKKAKVIRQDLEAAAKARNKLMANSTGGVSSASAASSGIAASLSMTAASDAKILAALHDQYVQLHGLTPHLPLLAQRLQALARQHQEAAVQATQLQATQELADHLSQHVTQLEQAVQTTQVAIQQSTMQMAQNIQALDERFRK